MSRAASRRTFVLVHGAWHGGWCWRRVADILEAEGHKVFAPTLTGLAERSHLLSREVTLDTHITDIVNLFRWEELDDAILCAHSYGGWPVSGAMEALRSRVSALVFVDGHLPDDGQSGVETSNGREEILAAQRRGEVSRPPKSAAYMCVNENDRTWVDGKLTPQPIGTSLQPIQLTGAREEVARKAYVRATGFPSDPFDDAFTKAKTRGWRPYEVPAGHDLMIDAPEVLGQIFLSVATSTEWPDGRPRPAV
jgi:pimeloyl-ACP methyl ester carboxylesterase